MGRSPWLWSLSSFLAAAGLQVSGFTNHYIGYSLMVVSGLLAIYAILRKKPQGSSKVGKVTVGNESVVMGDV